MSKKCPQYKKYLLIDNKNTKLSKKRYFSCKIINFFNEESIFLKNSQVYVTLLAWFTVKSLIYIWHHAQFLSLGPTIDEIL